MTSPVEFPYPSRRVNSELFEALTEALYQEGRDVTTNDVFVSMKTSPQTALEGFPILYSEGVEQLRGKKLSFRLTRDYVYVQADDEYYRMELLLTAYDRSFNVPFVAIRKDQFPIMTPTKVENPAHTFLRHTAFGTTELAVTYPDDKLCKRRVRQLLDRLDVEFPEDHRLDVYSLVDIEGEGRLFTTRSGRNSFHHIRDTVIDDGGLHPEVVSSNFQIFSQDVAYLRNIVGTYNDDHSTYIVTYSLDDIYVTWVDVKIGSNIAV
jgi:hypothetical protein